MTAAVIGTAGLAASNIVGDLGPLLGTVISPLAIETVRDWDARLRAKRIEQATGVVMIASGVRRQTLQQLLDEAAESPDLQHLVARAMEAAARVRSTEKLRWLGHLIVRGMDEPVTVDDTLLILEAVNDLEPPHLAVLRLLMDKPSRGRAGWSRHDIQAGLSMEFGRTLDPVLATLTRHGLIGSMSDIGDALRAREHDRQYPELRRMDRLLNTAVPTSLQYFVTAFGRRVVQAMIDQSAATDGQS